MSGIYEIVATIEEKSRCAKSRNRVRHTHTSGPSSLSLSTHTHTHASVLLQVGRQVAVAPISMSTHTEFPWFYYGPAYGRLLGLFLTRSVLSGWRPVSCVRWRRRSIVALLAKRYGIAL